LTEIPPLVVIIGPTAVGKTEISIRIAERLDGEIISADSRLLYIGMDIGTSKPTSEMRARVPHHLIDVTKPDEPWSLADYRSAALDVIEGIRQRGRFPILVGGTGQYVATLVEGWSPPPKSEDLTLRSVLETFADTHGSQALHERLVDVDPIAATQIDHRNIRRVVRALEIFYVTGVPFSEQRKVQPLAYRVLQIGLSMPRKKLYARIDKRIDTMLEAGFVDEVRELLSCGLSLDLPAMSAIGYRQIVDHLRGEISLEEAVRQIRRATRQFVRRQANWFKKDDPRIHWFEVGDGIEEEIIEVIRAWLIED
jgi:tRNA dimethylallyltransferase